MRSYFYKSTAFEITAATVPRCFVDRDKHLAPQIVTDRDKWTHRGVQLAEILCGRLADVAYFAEAIPKALRRRNPFNAGHQARTLLVAHLGACKAALDAGVITLTELCRLGCTHNKGPLTGGEVDFRRTGRFRTVLRTEHGQTYARYRRFFPMIDEIVVWRDAVVHRVPPLIMLTTGSWEHPSRAPRSAVDCLLVLEPEATIPTLPRPLRESASPTYFHERWYDDLGDFCGEICQDIGAHYGR